MEGKEERKEEEKGQERDWPRVLQSLNPALGPST